MAMSNEQKALLFLAGVVLLAAGVRAARARNPVGPAPARDELAAQIAAADSAGLAGGPRRGNSGRGARLTATAAVADAGWPVDVDTASAATLVRLPGIGPTIAGRIVEDRASHGPFGSLEALGTVKGIGPATLRRLDTLVTFSGPPRPPQGAPERPPPRGNRSPRVAGGR